MVKLYLGCDNLSYNTRNKLDKWKAENLLIERPNFDEIYMNVATEVARRSHDPQTQCGCVLTKNNIVIMTGYNGFVRDINDSVLPNTRPDKYPFMMHSEANCLLSCAREGISTNGATAYITGPPCVACLQQLWQAGITKIVHGKATIQMLDNDEYKSNIEILKLLFGNRLEIVEYSV